MTAYQFFPCAEARAAHLQGRWNDAIPIYMANRVQLDQWVSNEKNQLGMRAIVQNAMGAESGRPEAAQLGKQIATKVASQIGDLYGSIREDSTYFLGVAKFEQQDYKAATNWFAKSYLEKYPEGRWTSSARYHLGRCAEATGDNTKAIEYYTMTGKSLQSAGNLVRARRLGWDPSAASPSAATETAP